MAPEMDRVGRESVLSVMFECELFYQS